MLEFEGHILDVAEHVHVHVGWNQDIWKSFQLIWMIFFHKKLLDLPFNIKMLLQEDQILKPLDKPKKSQCLKRNPCAAQDKTLLVGELWFT